MTNCECLLAGYCQAHQRDMPEAWWQKCRTQPGVFELFQRDKWKWTGANAVLAPKPPAEAFPCIHRGEVIDEGTADRCGRKGEKFPIYACVLHGECVIGAFCVRQKWRSCLTCEDQTV